MYVCMCVNIYTTCLCVYICIYVYVFMCVQKHTQTYTFTRTSRCAASHNSKGRMKTGIMINCTGVSTRLTATASAVIGDVT